MAKIIDWLLVVFWLITLVVLMMGNGMAAMYMMVIGMLVDCLKCALLHK